MVSLQVNIAMNIIIVLTMLSIIVRVFWICNFCYKLNKDRKLLKRYLEDQEDVRVKKRIKYNYDTVQIRNIFLVFISIIEPLWLILIASVFTAYNTRAKTGAITNRVIHITPNCTVDPLIGLAYYEPIFPPLFIAIFSVYIFYITSLSMLCKFLTQRYIVLPYKRVLCRSVLWLSIQITILAICSTFYTFLISFLFLNIFIWFDWCVLIHDTTRLSKALKAKLTEISLFEFNQRRYLTEERAYTSFMLFTKIFLVGIFLSNIFMLIVSTIIYSALINGSICILNVLYGIKIDFNFNKSYLDHEKRLTHTLDVYVIPVMFIITILINNAPAFIYTTTLIGLMCAERCKKRQYRFTNEELMQNLLSANK